MFDAGSVAATLDLDRSPFITSLNIAERRAARIARKRYEAKLDVKGAAAAAAEIKGVGSAAERLDGQDIDINVDRDGSAAASLTSLSEGFRGLASNIRATGTVLAASSIPFGIAALGAAIPTVSALGASMAGLALNLGKAAVGFGLVAGAAGGGALAGLKAYVSLISETISSSREAYEALHEQRMEQLELKRQQILTTRASERFNQEIDKQIIRFSRLQAAVGRRVFPLFTRELRSWGFILRDLTPYIADTAGNIAGIAAGFSKWFRTADQGKVLRDVVAFISESATKGAATLAALGQAGIMAFRPLIPLASRFQSDLLGVVRQTARWVSSAEGQKKLGGIYRSLYSDAETLWGILLKLGRAVFSVFDAINDSGLADQATNGLSILANGLDRITEKGSEGRRTLMGFLRDVRGLMPFVGGAALALAGAVGDIASAAISARDQGSRLTILQQIFRGLERSAKPLRGLILGTFRDLGPEIARLIPEVARFLNVFAGASGPLVTFVRTIRRALEIFNDLPGPVKRLGANLLALKLILGGLGITGLLRPFARFAANMLLVNSASRAVAGASALPAVVGSIARLGLLLGAGIGLVALGGALYLVYRRNKLVREAVNNLVDRLKNHLRPEIGKVQDAWKNFGKGVAGRIDDLGDVIVDVFDLRRKNRERKIKQFGKNASVDFGLGLRSHARSLDKDGSPGDELGEKIGTQIGRAIKAYLLREGSKRNGIPDINASRWIELITPGGMANQFSSFFGRVIGPAIFKEVGWGPIKKEFRDQIISVITLAGLVPYLTRQTNRYIVKPIGNAIRQGNWGEMGRDAAWGIIKGFTGVDMGSWFGKKVRDAIEWVKRDNDGNSPWGSTEILGRDAALGWVRGIQRAAPAMAQAAKESVKLALGSMKDLRGFEAAADLTPLQRARQRERQEAQNAYRLSPLNYQRAGSRPVREWDMGSPRDMVSTILNSQATTIGKSWARYLVYHLNRMPDSFRLGRRSDIERLIPRLRQLGFSAFEDLSFVRNARMRQFQGGRRSSAGMVQAEDGSWVPRSFYQNRGTRQRRPTEDGARSVRTGGRGRDGSRAMTANEFRAALKQHTRDMARLMQAGMSDAPNLRDFQKQQDKVQGGYFGFAGGMGAQPQ